MGKNKKKGKNSNRDITEFVFYGTPISEAKTRGTHVGYWAGGDGSSKQPSKQAGNDIGQSDLPSSPDVSVTLNSFDTLSIEDDLSAATSGKNKRNSDPCGETNDCAMTFGLQNKTNNPLHTTSTTSANRDPDEGIPLDKVEVGEKVCIPEEGYPSLEEDWGFCLVGCFTGRFPGIKPIEDLMSSWGVQCKLLPHEQGWVLFQFLNDEDRRIVLQNGPYQLFGKTLLLRILPEDFRFNFDAFMKVDMWVKLIDVPLRCWNKIALQCLGSRVGTTKRTDQGTKKRGRISFCRMLIEVDMSKELPTSFEVCLPDGGKYIQKVVYEGLPKYCYHCKKFGHNLLDCRVLRALCLRKNGEFVGKSTKHTMEKGKRIVEGDRPSTSGGKTPSKTWRQRAGKATAVGTEATACAAARSKTAPKSAPKSHVSKSAAIPTVHELNGAAGKCPGTTAKPGAVGTELALEANRTPKEASLVGLPETDVEAGPSTMTPKDDAAPTAGQGDISMASKGGKKDKAASKPPPFKRVMPPENDEPEYMLNWTYTKEIVDEENKKIADTHNLHKELAAFNTKYYGRPEG